MPTKKLLAKIQAYGICGTTQHWIDAFISGRSIRRPVILASSNIRCASGNRPGTANFPVITNDIFSDIRLFMDDCILYCTIRITSDVSILQADIDKLFNWSVAWQLKFNTAKCHILSITCQRNKVRPTYTLNSDTLSTVDYLYLRVMITADLRWREHVQLTASKAIRTLIFVRCNIYSSTPECKSPTYTSLVRTQRNVLHPDFHSHRCLQICFYPTHYLDWNSASLVFRTKSPTSRQGRKSSTSHDALAVTGLPIAEFIIEVAKYRRSNKTEQIVFIIQ